MPSLAASMLLYGPPGIGKSSFCSGLDGSVFFDTEGGLKYLKVRRQRIDSWKAFVLAIARLEEKGTIRCDDGKSTTPRHVIIDTADLLQSFCLEMCSRKYGFDHPGDAEFGKGWDILKGEFQRPIARLNTLKPMILISHSKAVDERGRGMVKTSKIVPTLPGTARKVIVPMVDVIGYAGFEVGEAIGQERALIFRPTEDLEAKDRTGCLPAVMPLDPRELDKYPIVVRDTPFHWQSPTKKLAKKPRKRKA